MKLGDFELRVLSDGTFALDGGQMFGVVPKPLWEKKLPADSRNRVRLALRCLLVETSKHLALIETGIGDKFDAKYADIYGIEKSTTLLADLKRVGVRPEDIDIVINTHLHFDHCGWNTRREGGKNNPHVPPRPLFHPGRRMGARAPPYSARSGQLRAGVLSPGGAPDGTPGGKSGNRPGDPRRGCLRTYPRPAVRVD